MAPRLSNSAHTASLTAPSGQRTDVSQESRHFNPYHLDQILDAVASLASGSVQASGCVFLHHCVAQNSLATNVDLLKYC